MPDETWRPQPDDDLVTKLRRGWWLFESGEIRDMQNEAADEIERLRAQRDLFAATLHRQIIDIEAHVADGQPLGVWSGQETADSLRATLAGETIACCCQWLPTHTEGCPLAPPTRVVIGESGPEMWTPRADQ